MIRVRGMTRVYRMGDATVHALSGVDLDIEAGEYVSITGQSGSGKSTFMHLLGCLDRPTAGTYELNGQLVTRMTDAEQARIRNKNIGFVFQTFNLINRTKAIDNVAIPLIYARERRTRDRAMKALEIVGLKHRWNHKPSEISGGERQRVAIARAIVNEPSIVLADEPTGNLDSRTGEQILDIFDRLNAAGTTIILVTHEMSVAARARRLIHMADGRIDADAPVTDALRTELLQSAVLGAAHFEGHVLTSSAAGIKNKKN
ncbi:MAG: ABC transporter ATP-binding protein [Phycisphaerales bacterium]|nr:ABC transporter ATP-binding protein [Phycisphaerales bacterium]